MEELPARKVTERPHPVGGEAAKYNSREPAPPAALNDGEPLELSVETAVVLLVVNPYLVHVYWNFDPQKLPGIDPQLPNQEIPALLRFYDTTDGPPAHCFDVEVKLEARNWSVPLWSPARSCFVELGLSQGGFAPLARSNTVQTPRAWPVTDVEAFLVAPGLEEPAASLPEELPVPPVSRPCGADDRFLSSATASGEAGQTTKNDGLPDVLPEEQERARPRPSDLTGLAERQFSPGISSAPEKPAP